MTYRINDLIFQDADNKFGLTIPKKVYAQILKECIDAGRSETGGILIGNYTEDLRRAVVSKITGPPSDSKSGYTWFQRGVFGLQSLLDYLWFNKRQYYLGEWHYHPFASAEPSKTDIQQMSSIASTKKYHCPEPILLIIGGVAATSPVLKAKVFPQSRQCVDLPLTKSHVESE